MFNSLIKKIMAFFMAIASIFVIGNANNVDVTIDEAITTQSSAITFSMENKTGKIISQLNEVIVERKTDDGWTAVSEVAFMRNDIGITINPGEIYKTSIYTDSYLGESHLTAGTYRLTVSYNCHSLTQKQGSASVEFTVTEA